MYNVNQSIFALLPKTTADTTTTKVIN